MEENIRHVSMGFKEPKNKTGHSNSDLRGLAGKYLQIVAQCGFSLASSIVEACWPIS